MNEVIMNQAYVPSDAENGKFAVINPSTLSAMGLTGSYGRYALLTYDIAGTTNSGPLGTSGNPIYTTMLTIVSNVEVDVTGIKLDETISAVNCVVSTYVVKDFTVSNTLWIGSSSVPAGVPYTPILSNELYDLEIQNKTTGPIYFLPSATSFASVSASGIIIESETYYSTKRYISQFTIGSLSGGDIRVLGYYNNEV